MSSITSNFSALAANYLSNNIHRLERSTGCFVCMLCDIEQWRGTWNPDHFLSHVKQVHPDLDFLACIFCGLNWPIDKFVKHVVDHLSPNCSPSPVFACPVQSSQSHSSTPCSFQTNSLQTLRFHVFSVHRNNKNFKCSQCSHQETEFATWADHIKTHTFRLSHCTADGCNVKSPSGELLIKHAKQKHGAHFGGSVRDSIEFICIHNGTVPSFLRSTIFPVDTSTSEAVVSDTTASSPPPLPPIHLKSPSCFSVAINNANVVPIRNGQPCLPLCLRCPNGDYSTANWSRFISHMRESCDALLGSCYLHWCSVCSTVSTEQGLIEEHVQDEHRESNATVIRENLGRVSSAHGDGDSSCEKLGNKEILAPPLPPLPIDPALLAAVTPTVANSDATATVPPAADVFSAFSSFLNGSSSAVAQPSAAAADLIKTEITPKSQSLLFTANPFLDPQNISAVAALAAALNGFAVNPAAPAGVDEVLNPPEALVPLESNGLEETPDTPASSCTTATGDDFGRVGRTGDEELVSFPFDEALYRAEMVDQWVPDLVDQLAEKMQRFSTYVVKILGKENHRRVPQCPECERVFSYGLPDFKRHLLAIHLGVPREYLKDLLKFARQPKVEVSVAELQEQDGMRQMRPKEIEPGVRKIPLPYSIPILRRLIDCLSDDVREQIMTKMRSYCKMSALFEVKAGVKKYKCCQCSYSSPHALADVRKHILGSHCNISTKHFRFCLQASRLDNVDFCLLSDEKLSRLANEFASRRQPESAESETSSSTTGMSIKRQLSRTPSPETKPRLPDEDGVSSFTTIVPGSKTPVTVRIKAPVPPGSDPNASTSPSSSSASFVNNTSISVDLADIINTPGLETANQILDLPLPYSEKVLRELLEAAGALPHQVEDMSSKMKVYSANPMTRICQGGRTLAFRCSCSRLFITTRQPESKMRAATLADSRRHVMGVHARIPHEYITICCQASRISRENGFQLYPDEMLHRLAMDRPIKLNSPEATPNMHRTPSKSSSGTKLGILPPLRPLADISGESSEDTKKSSKSSRLTGLPQFLPLSSSSPSITAEGACGSDEISIVTKEIIDMDVVLQCLNEQNPKEIERVIDLPYSKTALQVLVRGYCPPSYFKVLLSKMQVYTAYKVFVTRRRGKRFFCCSGCNSVSPHGMGDIRKHILGVHAKVPERYKAAAMHCSRLSREDNSLLGDRSLLQLAKMKWKGTVIKPLAEMGMEIEEGGIAECVSMAPNPRNQRNSVNRLPEDTTMVEITANPTTTSEEGSCGFVYSCSACLVASTDSASMRSHVAREHLGARAYKCLACSEAFNLSADLISHCNSAHLNCTPDIPPLELPSSYRDAMTSIPISHEPDPLEPAISANKVSVAMEDDEMGKLWQILQDEQPEPLDLDDSSVTIPLPPPPTAEDTVVTTPTPSPSPAVFPCLMSMSHPSPPTPTTSAPSQQSPINGSRPLLSNGGSSRRKPSKANLVQFKPKVTNGGATIGGSSSISPAEDEIEPKRPRLEQQEPMGVVEQGV